MLYDHLKKQLESFNASHHRGIDRDSLAAIWDKEQETSDKEVATVLQVH